MINWIVSFGILLGVGDTILNNRFGMSEKFRQGFILLGQMMTSMAGIMALSPVLATALRPVILPLFHFLHIDPGMFGIILGSDMGGYQLAASLAEDTRIGVLAGSIIAPMFGGTITFSIPLGFSLIEKEDRSFFSTGILIGMCVIPVGSMIAGLMLGIPFFTLLRNLCFVLAISLIIILGFLFFENRMIRFLSGFARVIDCIGVAGMGIGCFTRLTGVEVIPGMTPILDTMQTVCSISITMLGMYPILTLVTKLFNRSIGRISSVSGLDAGSCLGLLFTVVSASPVFPAMKDMEKKGMVINTAWIVTCAATLGSQMGLVISMVPDALPAFLTAKFTSGAAAVAVAALYTARSRSFKRRLEAVSERTL